MHIWHVRASLRVKHKDLQKQGQKLSHEPAIVLFSGSLCSADTSSESKHGSQTLILSGHMSDTHPKCLIFLNMFGVDTPGTLKNAKDTHKTRQGVK